jgi:hypothetical protein
MVELLLKYACRACPPKLLERRWEFGESSATESVNIEINDVWHNYHGVTPFYIACCFGREAIAKLLAPYCTRRTINKNKSFDEQSTSLQNACFCDKGEIVKLLLALGANVDEKSIFSARKYEKITVWLKLAKELDESKNKTLFLLSKEKNKEVYDFLLKRSGFAKLDMLDNMKKQLVGVNSAGANNCKKLRDCCVNLLS